MKSCLTTLRRADHGNPLAFSTRFFSTNQPQYRSLINVSTLLNSKGKKVPLPEEDIQIQGYVLSIRKQKKIAFAAIRDGTSLRALQAIIKPEEAER